MFEVIGKNRRCPKTPFLSSVQYFAEKSTKFSRDGVRTYLDLLIRCIPVKKAPLLLQMYPKRGGFLINIFLVKGGPY